MVKYLYRTCPRCKDYLGVVVPQPRAVDRDTIIVRD